MSETQVLTVGKYGEIQVPDEIRNPTVLMVPLTTRLEALRFPATVLVEPDEQNGLRRPSVALVFQTAPVDKRFILERLGRISDNQLRATRTFRCSFINGGINATHENHRHPRSSH